MFSLDILQHSKSIIQWSVSCHLSESSKLNHCLFLLIFWGSWAEDWSEDCEDWAWLALDWFWRGLTASAQEKIISTRNINYKKLIGPWKTNILIIIAKPVQKILFRKLRKSDGFIVRFEMKNKFSGSPHLTANEVCSPNHRTAKCNPKKKVRFLIKLLFSSHFRKKEHLPKASQGNQNQCKIRTTTSCAIFQYGNKRHRLNQSADRLLGIGVSAVDKRPNDDARLSFRGKFSREASSVL